MSGVRDLFFDEFYSELERVAGEIAARDEEESKPSILADEVKAKWVPYAHDSEDREGTLISVDGGIQQSDFAYGDFVAAGRAIALIHKPGEGRRMERKVRIYVGQVYEDRDKSFIPGYVRTICEYDAAYAAAKKVLDEGGSPVVLMDGSLYIGRFPYAVREYRHHPELLVDFFESITRLRTLARDNGFPIVGVAKDSSVFFLYMELLKGAVTKAGLGGLVKQLDEASSPLDLRGKMQNWSEEEWKQIEPWIEARPLCDPLLVKESTETAGYTSPLYLSPSIYYADNDTPSLYRMVDKYLEAGTAARVKEAVKGFFTAPGVAAIYWKPGPRARPFRVDVLANLLGRPEAWNSHTRNMFLAPNPNLEKVLNHLGHWFCNEVEYNIPLKQADMLAHFDRDLYHRKYEPFIIRRLEEAGLDVEGKRRTKREFG
ncbi:MAG: DNA double-strand break repair nuclease NurA [Candidatus Bathyarchaeota archaeon]|nr:DNA double-strand break repair nuclease NurA [Candidatus Bathyarchaeota archaeon]